MGGAIAVMVEVALSLRLGVTMSDDGTTHLDILGYATNLSFLIGGFLTCINAY